MFKKSKFSTKALKESVKQKLTNYAPVKCVLITWQNHAHVVNCFKGRIKGLQKKTL